MNSEPPVYFQTMMNLGTAIHAITAVAILIAAIILWRAEKRYYLIFLIIGAFLEMFLFFVGIAEMLGASIFHSAADGTANWIAIMARTAVSAISWGLIAFGLLMHALVRSKQASLAEAYSDERG